VNISDAIKNRRSVSVFDPGHQVSEAEVRELVEAANLSPSSFNIQHWRFVWLRDEALLDQARQATWFQPQVTDAALVLVVCMDLKAWRKSPERYWRNAPEKVAQSMIDNMRKIYADNPRLERDEALRSASMASMAIMLKAQGMGYDSCAMACDTKKMAELINLPDDHDICMVLAIGKRLEEPYPRPGLLTVEEVLVENSF
jgi:nitroreductase